MTCGPISAKSLRCLNLIALHGASSVSELAALDATDPSHRGTINGLYSQGYLESDGATKVHGNPVRYSLTSKAIELLGAGNVRVIVEASGPKPRKNQAKAKCKRPPVGANVAGPTQYSYMSTQGTYSTCKDLQTPPLRPGADAALSIPSRWGSQLRYRDGHIDQVNP